MFPRRGSPPNYHTNLETCVFQKMGGGEGKRTLRNFRSVLFSIGGTHSRGFLTLCSEILLGGGVETLQNTEWVRSDFL